jgi:hypothetical protein
MRIFLILAFLLVGVTADAQPTNLYVSSDKRKSVQYKVGPKETLFSLGRKFYVHPRFLASFNKLSYDKGLQLGQSILIPLTDTNFSLESSTGIPVYRVGKNQKKQLLGRIVKNEELLSAGLSETPLSESTPVASSVDLLATTEVNKDHPKATASPAVQEPSRKIQPISDTIVTTEEAGYFKYAYEEQLLSLGALKQTVKTGIFKTTSGWNDKKYYLLTNSASPGTYVQLYAPATQKTVYAKVLGEMSGIRQNEGYDIRISNAAAAALGINELAIVEVEMSYTAPVKR